MAVAVAHATPYLAGDDEALKEFTYAAGRLGVRQELYTVLFNRSGVLAKNRRQWFQYLRDHGGKRAFLAVLPKQADYWEIPFNHAFTGNHNWAVCIETEDRPNYWHLRINSSYSANPSEEQVETGREIPSPRPGEERIELHWGLFLADREHVFVRGKLAACEQQLNTLLTDLILFCAENELEEWRSVFVRSLSILESKIDLPIMEMGRYFPSRGYSPRVQRLLYSALGADVLGGMDSWNDQYFQNQEVKARFDALSSRIGPAVVEAIVVALDQFEPSSGVTL
ncbi:hypothetical protein [Fimbriimonas ginsengisoli]|nr:hypothetical protein [Fimbriimonas ginsengisoli]